MSDQEIRTADDDVEGHLLKEALAAGAAAAAITAGSASAQLPIGDSGASAGARAPGYVVDPGAGGTGGKLEPGPSGGTGSKVEPGPSGGTGSKAKAKAKAKKAPSKRAGRR